MIGVSGHRQECPEITYCNSTNFRTPFSLVYFVLLAESTKFSSIRKPYTYTSASDTIVAVRKFLAYESRQNARVGNFSRTKISAIAVHGNGLPAKFVPGRGMYMKGTERLTKV